MPKTEFTIQQRILILEATDLLNELAVHLRTNVNNVGAIDPFVEFAEGNIDRALHCLRSAKKLST